MIERSLLSVVDDDESVRESLPDLLSELGFESRVFSSAEAFLESGSRVQTKCLILDVGLPGAIDSAVGVWSNYALPKLAWRECI